MVLSASSGLSHDSLPSHPGGWLVAQACPHPYRDTLPSTSNLQLGELQHQTFGVVVYRHFYSRSAHSLDAHGLSASPKPHGRESRGQRDSTWGLSISKQARCAPTLFLTPRCCVSGYCMSQVLHATVGLWDHGSALDGIDPWLGLGLQSSGGRHRAARLQSCFEEHESRIKCHEDVANTEKMFAFWLGCYPPHYAELFPRCLHSSCKRKKPKCPRYGGSISGALEAACCDRNGSGDEARVTGWVTHPSCS